MAGIAARLLRDREAAEGLGSHERAIKYLNEDYEALRAECLEAGALFQDPSFPAAPSSLGFKELGPYSSKTQGIEWKRPTVGGEPGARDHGAQPWSAELSAQSRHPILRGPLLGASGRPAEVGPDPRDAPGVGGGSGTLCPEPHYRPAATSPTSVT